MSLKILYCEDDEALAQMTKDLLSVEFPGCEITYFDNATDAIKLLQEGAAFDILLSDNNMPPGPDGFDTLVYVLENELYLPFVLMSGEDLLEAIPQGGLFLLKPYNREELLKFIAEAIDSKSAKKGREVEALDSERF